MASALRTPLMRQVLAASSKPTLASALPAFRVARTLAPTLQRATFQTSTRRAILPPLPQTVKGTVNDAAIVPEAEPMHGAYHWTMERLVSAAIVPLTVAPFAAGSLSPVLDGAFIGLIIIHSYIGFQSCITDYFPKWRVPITRKVCEWANFAAVFLVGWGFYEFETNDVGLTEGVRRIWKA